MPGKILFIIDSFAGGGAERVLTRVLAGLDRSRFQPSLCLLLRPEQAYQVPDHVPAAFLEKSPLPVLASWLILAAATLLALPKVFRLAQFRETRAYAAGVMQEILSASFSLRDQLRRDAPDAAVVFLHSSTLITLLTLIVFRIPVPVCCSDRIFLSREVSYLRYPKLVSFLLSLLYRRTQRYIAVSEAIRSDMNRSFGIPGDKMVTIYNGVDLDLLARLAAEPAPEGSLRLSASAGCTIVTSGRLTKQKGHALLLQAFSRVRREAPCRLVILGEGELRGELEQLAAQLGIAGEVLFAGWQQNPFRLLAGADLFVLCSEYEGFPNALLEAMALGLPVISTDCPTGPSELLDAGRYGLLVPTADADALAGAMLSLVRDHSLRRSYAQLSRERAACFSLQRMVTSYQALLDDLVSGVGG